MFLLGIDGGGTSTKLEMRDRTGKLIFRKQFGSSNITAIGREAYRERFREIFRICGGMKDCASLCIGGAGVTKTEAGEILRNELEAAGFSGQLKLCGDHEIALRGAMEGPGCILIAGTGSIAYGVNERGEGIRVGGYGHLIDDCGSGYAIGRDALALTVKTLDGRIEENLLAERIMKQIGAQNAGDLVNFVYAPEKGKSAAASLAPLVIQLAETGESQSVEILRGNSDELVCMVSALVRRLSMPSPRIVLAGGLLSADTLYRQITAEKLSRFASVQAPEHDALHGAIAFAADALKKK